MTDATDEPLAVGARVVVAGSAHHMPDAPGFIAEVSADRPNGLHYVVRFDYGIEQELVPAQHVHRAGNVLA